jgi:hypothetical protein
MKLLAHYHGDTSVGILPRSYEFDFGGPEGYSPFETLAEDEVPRARENVRGAFIAFLASFEEGHPGYVFYDDEIEENLG